MKSESESETGTGTGSAAFGSGAMFDAIAENYDRMNRVISLGIDIRWRARAVEAMHLGDAADARSYKVLDVATGTGDLALATARAHVNAHVVGVDPSQGMLAIGREKVGREGLAARVSLETGDAEALAFEANTFDAVSIAFGIRNVRDRMRALREFERVVKAGGRVVILELGEPDGAVLGAFARMHVHRVVPFLGRLFSGAREYRYLEQSIAAFPPRPAFAEMMREAGLDVLEVIPLTMGAATLFVAEKAARSPGATP